MAKEEKEEQQEAYIGLTIGPIIKTLMAAKKTRELWAASYTFAYLMKQIASAFNKQYPNRTWVKPALGETARIAFQKAAERKDHILSSTGVGIFPDHLIFSSDDEKDVDHLKSIAIKVIEDYGESLAAAIGKPEEGENIQKFLTEYFQINIVRKEVPVAENPILAISSILSIVELQQTFPTEKASYLNKLFDRISDSFLTEDAFGRKQHFLSIPEIALTTHLLHERADQNGKTCRQYVDSQRRDIEDSSKEEDEKYIDWVKEFLQKYKQQNPKSQATFFTGQKYIAVVQMDGDSIGALLKTLPKEQLPSFSEKLTQFAVEAAGLVHTYEGMPVYFGGDDALFFAPVIHGDQNIFQLLRGLDEAFGQQFKDFDADQKPTLSFGLSISYTKYPLYEVLKHSGDLLRKIAKEGFLSDEIDQKTKEKVRKKNNIAYRVLRHSGSSISGLIHLNSEVQWSNLNAFLKVLDLNIAVPNEALKSIIYRIPENETLFQIIGKDKEALANFLDNSFDEDVHVERQKYIDAVAELINHVYLHQDRYPIEQDKETFSGPDRIAYNLLKTIAFLTTPEQ